MPDPRLTDPATFSHWHPILPRFRDLDVLGHVSHVSTVSWLEEARVALELPIQPIEELKQRPVIVLAQLTMRFLAEVHWKDEVKVGSCLLQLGRSSMTVGQAIFSGGRCAIIADGVEVLIGQETRKPEPFPPDWRAYLEGYVARTSSAGGESR